MGRALKGVPEAQRNVPEGVVSAKTDADPAAPPEARGIQEYFYREFAPSRNDAVPAAAPAERPAS